MNNEKIKKIWADTSLGAVDEWEKNVIPVQDQIASVKVFETEYDSKQSAYYYDVYENGKVRQRCPYVVVDLWNGDSIWFFGGLCCGYCGTGPDKACLCLEKIGIPEELTARIEYASRLNFVRESEGWREIWGKYYINR